ncbi:MAG: aminotransferase class I/II-fold pyridoxal phosphate-dependent enzyme [Bowdeniella nasicola]|nr:aminotransferase class I/II-fold pyridoxal phosphate-dependent enzyme [Bowdeniella nasicola]
MTPSSPFGDFSDYSAEAMVARGTRKWSLDPDAIGAWIAEMDFGIAPPIARTITSHVAAGTFGYLPAPLAEAAKEATATWYRRAHDWSIESSAVRLFPDVLTALQAAITHGLAEGAPVVVPTPNYMPFLTLPSLFGRRIIEVPGLRDEAGHYRLDISRIDAALSEGGLLILCNPWNPVGRVLTRAELREVEQVVSARGARVFADEIHAPVVLEESCTHVPYASLSQASAAHTLTAISNSKGWNIPGLKCAQMIVSNDADAAALEPWVERYEHLASPLGVACAVSAYTECDAWLDDVREVLRNNRDLFADLIATGLPEAVHAPAQGTYLAWVDLRPYGIEAPGEFLATRARVIVNDGAACGAPGFARVNLAMSPDNVHEAARRIVEAVRSA